MNKSSSVYIAGHTGLVGSALVRKLQANSYTNLLLKTQDELNLEVQQDVTTFFAKERPEYVFLAAAKVGGILANNTHPAEFIYNNLMIQTNVIHAAYKFGVKSLLFLGSSCIYPKFAPQPLKEEYLLTGELESTNEAYAIAKIAGIKMCEAYNRQYGTKFISVMPTNLYGSNDNFDLETSHVLPAMIRKFHEAKLNVAPKVLLWGTGLPRREFLHVDDLAEASVFLMNLDDEQFVSILRSEATHSTSKLLFNIGTGDDITIEALAEIIAKIVGYSGDIVWDKTKPDGTPRKMLNIGRIKSLGWMPKIKLENGVRDTYEWYINNGK